MISDNKKKWTYLPLLAANKISLIKKVIEEQPAALAWQQISQKVFSSNDNFLAQHEVFTYLFPEWPNQLDSAPAWMPDATWIKTTNLAKFMREQHFSDLKTFQQWTTQQFEKFWGLMAKTLQIQFSTSPTKVCDLKNGLENPQWFVGGRMNITQSCFQAPLDKKAIIYLDSQKKLQHITYGELDRYTNQIANGLIEQGFKPQDAIAIYMPMNKEAVAIYLGIIKMGGVVVSIPDSFSAEEIKIRLLLSHTKAIFTQDFVLRDTKKIFLYEKTVAAESPTIIVLSCQDNLQITLRPQDLAWQHFLSQQQDFQTYVTEPMAATNILFSSGTTGAPKAIPWNHTTGIKSASDAYFHQDIQSDDILAWPTNLGWMMGPWLIFATLINQATMALYTDLPRNREFGQFVADAKVTMLGVVPALVAAWRQTECMQGLNWTHIRKFSSTAECSNPEDMLYLMSLANYKPIIEYCGGTETGGAYISSTMIEKNYPSVFTTPVMGSRFDILDEQGKSANVGEVVLIPPTLGLSTKLIQGNHHDIYYANMPEAASGDIYRRHSDELKRLASGLFCVLGRVDDTMKLSGIKISSAELERAIAGIDHIIETAAVAIPPPQPGPSRLVIFASTNTDLNKEEIKKLMQQRINHHLTPLFKIYDVILLNQLPKTASNKTIRKAL